MCNANDRRKKIEINWKLTYRIEKNIRNRYIDLSKSGTDERTKKRI